MRSRGLTPSAFRPLATRLVLMSNSANVVARPSNSKAIASPQLFARSCTISTSVAEPCEADMSFPPYCLFSRSLSSSRAKDNTEKPAHSGQRHVERRRDTARQRAHIGRARGAFRKVRLGRLDQVLL